MSYLLVFLKAAHSSFPFPNLLHEPGCKSYPDMWSGRPQWCIWACPVYSLHGFQITLLNFKFSLENRVKKTGDSSCSLLSHFWSISRSPFSTFYIPFQISRSQESNASNGVRFGVETKKLQPLQEDHSSCFCTAAKSAFCCDNFATFLSDARDLRPWRFTSLSLASLCCACHIEYKIAEKAMNFMSYMAEVSRGWNEPNARDMGRMTSQPNAKGEIYGKEIGKARNDEYATVQAISQTPLQAMPCAICLSYEHLVDECPTIPAGPSKILLETTATSDRTCSSTTKKPQSLNKLW
ncbi:hypothetical protein AAG906_001621 [Vitis piasezkii]